MIFMTFHDHLDLSIPIYLFCNIYRNLRCPIVQHIANLLYLGMFILIFLYMRYSDDRRSMLQRGNLIAAFSYFDSSSEDFYIELLDSITDRASKLQPISVQHILTALCRLQGRLAKKKMQMPLERLCET